MKLDILALCAHPDDAEISCAGTLAKHISLGYKAGVIDLTQGELGTRGTVEIREKEAAEAARLIGLSVRKNLKLRDGFFGFSEEEKLKIISVIRAYQPQIVLTNAVRDRHPDHGKAAALVRECCFLSGLSKVKTDYEGETQNEWRPRQVFHFVQSQYIKPDFIVDVSDFWNKKMEALQAFKSQFYNPQSHEPETFISNPGFMKLIEARGHELGYSIGAKYGEGFTVDHHLGIDNLFHLK
ncbi:MAG: bacillithiol biosynthesis deacetylase BshB1 [Bacteroidetes bacterium]|nr:bacillithiol biosynthesis deacetylase BshB1 [Bacteroidota bacterium]